MTDFWKDDADLFAQSRRELFASVVGDIMDKLGFRHQFLPPAIQLLERNMVTIGRAMTVLEADYFEEVAAASHNPISARPFGLMLDAVDELKPNEVYTCTGDSARYALWGELMSTRAIHCGAAGAVLDGYSRDTKGIPSPMDRSRWTRGLAARSWIIVWRSKWRVRASNPGVPSLWRPFGRSVFFRSLPLEK